MTRHHPFCLLKRHLTSTDVCNVAARVMLWRRVVDKARQISEDQRKLVQLMQDAANAEIAVAQQSGSPGALKAD